MNTATASRNRSRNLCPSRILGALCCLTAFASGLGVSPAFAQFRRLTSPVTVPPTSLVDPGGALATDLNPAALPFTNSWDVLYVHADATGGALIERGDAVHMGIALPLGLGAGLSGQVLRPTDDTGLGRRGRLSLGAAWSAGPTSGWGAAIRYQGSDDNNADDITTFDLAWTWRPDPRLGFAFVGHDLFGPLRLTPSAVRLPATFVWATAFRPFGHDAMTLEAAAAVNSERDVAVRGLVAVGIPSFGQASVVVEADDLSDQRLVRVLGGVTATWGGLSASGGVFGGDGLEDELGWYVAGRLTGGVRDDGLPLRSYVEEVDIEGSLGARGVVTLVTKLDRALHDKRVAGVLLRVRSSGLGMAYAQELRLMIHALERAGKKVVCHLDSATGTQWYACAAASRTLIDPAGVVRLTGPSIDVILLGGLLKRAGVRADFVRIGKYKSAPEQLTNQRMSEPAREQREALLSDVYGRFVTDLARDMERSPERVRALVNEGPYLAEEAIAARMVAEAADEHDFDDALAGAFGRRYARAKTSAHEASKNFGVARRVGVVMVDGTIVDGENVDIPIVEIHQSGAQTVISAIERLAADRSVRAIVLRVDSPGGSALASDQIWRAVRRAREKKPVIASLGNVAASGGYYIASAASEIWADPATLTGSIGVFFGKIDVQELVERYGVHVEQLRRGARAGAESLFRPFSDDERAVLAEKIRKSYRLFLSRVAEGRSLEVEQVDALGQGRIWSGDAAKEKGLVDRLGGFGAVLARARQLGGLPPDATTVVRPERPSSLLDYLTAGLGTEGRASARALKEVVLSPAVRDALQTVWAMKSTRSGTLALMPDVVRVR